MADDAAAPKPGAPDHRWQSQAFGAAQAPDRGARRRVWLFVLAGLFLALLALVIVWLLLIKPPPAPPFFLSIHIGEHDARRYPPIPFIKEDGDRFKRHFPAAKLAETKTKELLRKELAGLAEKTEPVIVEINALAIARAGKVLLLPGDADPADEATWLDVSEVLGALKACPAEHKLLILELAHPLADARLGVLTDRVAETLEDSFAQDPPPFHVLCPCAANQYALTSETLQGSVFAYYMDQGLQGPADADRDMRITVKELFDFVEARVDRWAQNNRAVGQKPRLFGKAVDFPIASLGKNTPGALPRAELEAYPERLQNAWKQRDDWWDKEAFRRAPRLFGKLNATLMRQEKLMRGGAMPAKDVDALDEETRNLTEKLKRALTVRNAPPSSLALALTQAGVKTRSQTEFGNEAVVNGVLDIFTRIKDSGPKADINAKAEAELLKKLQEPKDADFPRQAVCLVEALCQVPRLKTDHVRVCKDVLAKLKPKQQYVETLYVERLAGLADRKDLDAPQWDKVQSWLQSVRTRELIVALLDREPGLLPWLDADMKEADALRRGAEEKLLWKGKSTWDDAFDKLASAKKKYEAALGAFNILFNARWQLDKAIAELPAYGELICAWPDFDFPAEQSWNKAADEAERVQAFFANPPEPGIACNDNQNALKLDAPGRALKRHLQDLGKTLERRIAHATKEEKAVELREMLVLLDSPLLTAPQRVALYAKQRAVGKKLDDANDKLDQDDNQAHRLSPYPDAPRKVGFGQVQGLARAEMSLALLRLGRFDMKGKNVALPAKDRIVTPVEWANLERRWQEFWTRDLPKQWHSARPGFVADALNRIVSPWELDRRAGDIEREPSRLWQEQRRDAYLRWLQERYRSEADFLDRGAQEGPTSFFYRQAAQELRQRGVEPD